MEDEQSRIIARLKRWMSRNQSTLEQAGVAVITGTYSGSGDEGKFDEIHVVDGQGIWINYELPDAIRGLIEMLAECLSPPGYENEEGGGGEIGLHIGACTITHESYFYVVERSPQGAVTY